MKKVRSQLGLAPNQKIGRSGKEATGLGWRNEWRRWCDQSQGDRLSTERKNLRAVPAVAREVKYPVSLFLPPTILPQWPNPAGSWLIGGPEKHTLEGPHSYSPLALTALQSRAGRPRVGTQASLKVLVNHFVPPKTVRGCIRLYHLCLQLLARCLTYGSHSNTCSDREYYHPYFSDEETGVQGS